MANDILKEVSTSDLAKELTERCAPAVFIGTKYEGIGHGWRNFSNWQGNPATCFGMCCEMAFNILMDKIGMELDEREDGKDDSSCG